MKYFTLAFILALFWCYSCWSADLSSQINTANDNQTISLPAGTFIVKVGTTTVKASHVHVVGVGETSIIRFVRVEGSSSGFVVQGEGFELSDVHVDSDQPRNAKTKVQINVIRQFSDGLNVHDCTYSNVDTFVYFTGTGSGIVRDCKNLDKTMRSDHFFMGGCQNVMIENCVSQGSWNEHVARIDNDSQSGGLNTSWNITFRHCDFVNDMDGKETIAVRTAKGNITIDDCDLRSWFRVGQVNVPPRPLTVGSVFITNCRIYKRAWLQIDQGVSGQLTNNLFQNYNAYVPIHVNGPGVKLVGTGTKLKDMEPTTSHDLVTTTNMGPHDVVNVK